MDTVFCLCRHCLSVPSPFGHLLPVRPKRYFGVYGRQGLVILFTFGDRRHRCNSVGSMLTVGHGTLCSQNSGTASASASFRLPNMDRARAWLCSYGKWTLLRPGLPVIGDPLTVCSQVAIACAARPCDSLLVGLGKRTLLPCGRWYFVVGRLTDRACRFNRRTALLLVQSG